VNRFVMLYVVTDVKNDYIFVSDFYTLTNHLNQLIQRVCHTEPTSAPLPDPSGVTNPATTAAATTAVTSTTTPAGWFDLPIDSQ